ncbi:MAG: hypothetical protein LUD83_02020 [Clostridiales bacterium]|nr:hypothetical protein [Clostridiales bacterium]
MNTANLHELINRYEENFDMINNSEHCEIFKWKALNGFRKVWFSDKAKDMTFAQRFNAAMKDSSILINNSMISPTSGVVKLAEAYPERVETLFQETLFSGETDLVVVQDQMDRFLDEMEKMRMEKFPHFYRYKQERHAASCYLFFFRPEVHFIYRYTDAEAFATYLEFGKDLGSGASFSLSNYYELAEIAVDALKEHTSLLEKHRKLIENNSDYYNDESLHLMAFDLMYCSRCYNFYSGLTHTSKKESVKAYTLRQLREKEEQERLARIQALEDAIHAIELQLEDYESISLLNVEVTQRTYGTGTIIKQEKNRITVKFPDTEKQFIIHKKYAMRPTFENDAEIVEAFTAYDDLDRKKAALERQLHSVIASAGK